MHGGHSRRQGRGDTVGVSGREGLRHFRFQVAVAAVAGSLIPARIEKFCVV